MDSATLNNLMQSKEPLLPELEAYVSFCESLGMKVFHHPLIIDIPFTSAALVNARYTFKKKALEQHIANGEWDRAIALTERPYRLDQLLKLESRMDRSAFMESSAYVWIDSENIFQHQRVWRRIWSSVTSSDWEWLLEDFELDALADLPDVITVYRGVGLENAKRGLSWTTDRAQAEWFARRNARSASSFEDAEAVLITGTVKKQDVAAYFLGRGESEVVALPENVTVDRTEVLD